MQPRAALLPTKDAARVVRQEPAVPSLLLGRSRRLESRSDRLRGEIGSARSEVKSIKGEEEEEEESGKGMEEEEERNGRRGEFEGAS